MTEDTAIVFCMIAVGMLVTIIISGGIDTTFRRRRRRR